MSGSRQKIKREVKLEILAGLDRKHLVTLKFSRKDSQEKLDWEHEAEFEYRGVMYDVVESEVCGDSIAYVCYPDRKETALNNQIRKLVAFYVANQPQNRENNQRVMNFFKTLFLHEPFQWNLSAPSLSQGAFPVLHCTFQTRCVEIPVPPPRIGQKSFIF
jgi:hypothetical protein